MCDPVQSTSRRLSKRPPLDLLNFSHFLLEEP